MNLYLQLQTKEDQEMFKLRDVRYFFIQQNIHFISIYLYNTYFYVHKRW